VHLMAAIPNTLMLERMEPDWSGRAETTRGALAAAAGHLSVPTVPGLGVAINPDFVAAHPSQRNADLARGGWNPGTEGETLYLQARRQRARITLSKAEDTDD